MLETLKQCNKLVVGRKQVLKALASGEAQQIYVALNAEQKTVKIVIDTADNNDIPVNYVPTMKELGQACKIQVGAACAAIIKEA